MKDSVVQRMRAELEEERLTLSARLDAIDLVLDNLSRVYTGLAPAKAKAKKQPTATKPVPRLVKDDDSDAAKRRDDLLKVIAKAEHGVTIADLRRQLPKIDGQARSNALYKLKASGAIKRVGNAWVKAA